MIRKVAVRPCNDDNCSICLDKLKSKKFVIQLPCKHQFHFKCYRQWEQKSFTCPVCRRYNFFELYHFPIRYKHLRRVTEERYNRRYWPTLYNKVLSELRHYIRVCRDEDVPVEDLYTCILGICQNRVESQDDAWYYDKALYEGRALYLVGSR
jgi:hypothetical protein